MYSLTIKGKTQYYSNYKSASFAGASYIVNYDDEPSLWESYLLRYFCRGSYNYVISEWNNAYKNDIKEHVIIKRVKLDVPFNRNRNNRK